MPGRRPRPEFTGRQKERVAERVRRNQNERISEIQKSVGFSLRVIRDVTLADNVQTPVPHGMGRAVSTIVSPARRTGLGASTPLIRRVDGTFEDTVKADPTKFVTLLASGWGSSVIVDVWVY